MSRFTSTETPLIGLKVIERQLLADARGFLSRMFCADELRTLGWVGEIVQINHTMTLHRGTVRGLHFQMPPHAEFKLVSCIRGEVWDVAVDLRQGSPTFMAWHAEVLSAKNRKALLIPKGFAHGFQALTDDVELIYCHSAQHVPDAEGGLRALDTHLAIAWPLPVINLSARDLGFATNAVEFDGVPS